MTIRVRHWRWANDVDARSCIVLCMNVCKCVVYALLLHVMMMQSVSLYVMCRLSGTFVQRLGSLAIGVLAVVYAVISIC
jgi:hypothetical protein